MVYFFILTVLPNENSMICYYCFSFFKTQWICNDDESCNKEPGFIDKKNTLNMFPQQKNSKVIGLARSVSK